MVLAGTVPVATTVKPAVATADPAAQEARTVWLPAWASAGTEVEVSKWPEESTGGLASGWPSQDSCTAAELVQSNRSPVMCTGFPGAPLAGSTARAAGAVAPAVWLTTVKD